MGKIIDKKGIILKQDENCSYGTVIDFLENEGYICIEYKTVSELVQTMIGDSCTPFNTIGEMIKYIPEIVSCGEECSILNVYGDTYNWFILGWNFENNTELNNTILHTYYSDLDVVED